MKKNQSTLSGVIITFNEERNIGRCIDSLEGICDEIVVVDSFSTDSTKEICLSKGVRFIENAFEGHIEQKNFAMNSSKHDYILSLDADEALSSKLKESILEIKKDGFKGAYRFNRFTNFCGQWIKHCGWYPDDKLRIWNKEEGHWAGTNPHDCIEVNDGVSVQKIKGDLHHYSYYYLHEHSTRSINYAKIAAKAMKIKGKSAPLYKILFSGLFRFIKDYFFRLGFLDGINGLIICTTNGYTTFLKYVYLRSLNANKEIG